MTNVILSNAVKKQEMAQHITSAFLRLGWHSPSENLLYEHGGIYSVLCYSNDKLCPTVYMRVAIMLSSFSCISLDYNVQSRDEWVPVTTTWRVLRLRMEERPPIWRVAANILNKQSRTADEEWSSSLGVGRGANNASPWKTFVRKYSQGEMLPLETKQSGGKLLPHSDLRGRGGVSRGGITQQEKGHFIGYVEC